MKGMFVDVLEQTLQAEMDQHLGYDHAERRVEESKKNYRNGEFEPQIVGKYQRNADGIEERILSL